MLFQSNVSRPSREMEEIKSPPMKMFVKSEAAVEVEIKVEEEYYVATDDMDSEINTDKYEGQGFSKSSEVYDLMISQPTKDVYSPMRCRLCALPNNVMVDIFSSEGIGNNIVEKIEYCLCIVVKESDPLPKQVCSMCLEKLEMCYDFNETVAEAENQLLAYCQQTIAKIEETESSCVTVSPYSEYDRIGGAVETCSGLEISPESTTVPEEVQATNNIGVKSSPLLSCLKPCSVVLVPTDIRSKNNITKDKKGSSSNGEAHLSHNDPRSTCGVYRANTDGESQATKKDKENRGSNKPVTIGQRRHKCISCAKTFKSKKYLAEHEKIHTNAGVYSCKFCRKEFADIVNHKRHLLSHTVERPLKCSVCGKKFCSKASRDRHHFTHTGEQPYKCFICGKRFNTRPNRDRHHRIHAREKISQVISRPQTPKKIPVTRREKAIKDLGMKNPPIDVPADIGRRRYNCNSCSKAFTSRQYLIDHTRIHTGIGLHSCDYCGKKFITKWKRNCHYRIHTSERPFKCSICDKDFKTKAHRDRHHLIHTRHDFYKSSIFNSDKDNH